VTTVQESAKETHEFETQAFADKEAAELLAACGLVFDDMVGSIPLDDVAEEEIKTAKKEAAELEKMLADTNLRLAHETYETLLETVVGDTTSVA
jgi:hypothetical protein